MSYYVHLHVCFPCDNNEGVAILAEKYREVVADCIEAQWFLDDLTKRTGYNPGPNGGLSTWGIVGNYTEGATFVNVLRPFWKELLRGVDGGPISYEHVIVFEEPEEAKQATAFEIFLESDTASSVTINKHKLPFAWAHI